MFAPLAGFADGTIVGGGSIDATETDPSHSCLSDNVGGDPDSEVVAPVSIQSLSGIRPGTCSLVESCMDLTEDYGGDSGTHTG